MIDQLIKFDIKKVLIIGINNAISMSKIKKIIVIKKNRNENGIREEEMGSNPHSNGDIFSKFNFNFFDKKIDTFIINIEIKNRIK